MDNFENLNLSKELLSAIKNLKITVPTEIQVKSIPHILQGKDVMGESATGSGKTLAFGCGIIEKVVPKQGLQALVLTPTRELALQVHDSIKKFAGNKRLKTTTVYGGVSISPQIDSLKTAEVVIATPGRLLDHMERRTINLSKIKLFILDEADRMLDMGFIEDVEKIVKSCPKDRQTLFFSATFVTQIKKLAQKHMKDPIKVSAKNQVDPSKLKQEYYDVKKNVKLSLLMHLLKKERTGLVIVFCNTRQTTDFVVKNVKANKIDAISIHGGLTQNKRSKTIGLFNGAKVGVLVCTDVASRGLHIDNVSHVYNYEIPKDAKDYVHRIGRTARAGDSGKVINLLSEFDYDNFSRIMEEYRSFKIDRLDVPNLEKINIVKVEKSRSFPKRNFGSRSSHRGPRVRR
jgi:ATP-dependent RNA helicase DeaD